MTMTLTQHEGFATAYEDLQRKIDNLGNERDPLEGIVRISYHCHYFLCFAQEIIYEKWWRVDQLLRLDRLDKKHHHLMMQLLESSNFDDEARRVSDYRYFTRTRGMQSISNISQAAKEVDMEVIREKMECDLPGIQKELSDNFAAVRKLVLGKTTPS